MFDIGQKLTYERIRKGMTQLEFSRRSGIPQANLSNIEKGKQDITVSTLLKICDALALSPSSLFREERSAPPSLTRASLERMARAVLEPAVKLSPEERAIVSHIRILMPGVQRRPLAEKKIRDAWYELKKKLPSEAIRGLLERIQDAGQRQKAGMNPPKQLSNPPKSVAGPSYAFIPGQACGLPCPTDGRRVHRRIKNAS